MIRTYFEQYFDTAIEYRHAVRRDLGMSTKASDGSACIFQLKESVGYA